MGGREKNKPKLRPKANVLLLVFLLLRLKFNHNNILRRKNFKSLLFVCFLNFSNLIITHEILIEQIKNINKIYFQLQTVRIIFACKNSVL